MNSPLHILLLEDDPSDAALVQSTLERDGISCSITCVQDRDAFMATLEHGGVDLILSDSSLPASSGLPVSEVAQTKWPAIPFIPLSGTPGEEMATGHEHAL